jgi:hypothetical protein
MTYLLIFTILSPLILWVLFYYLFNVLGGNDKRQIPVWIVGVLVDIYVNVTWGTLMFLQPPHYKRLFLSARMDDHIVNGSGWRFKLSLWIVAKLLAPYDKTGQHSTHGYTL